MERRNEVMTEIARLSQYILRTDITAFKREQTLTKLEELKAELRKIDKPPERIEDPRIPIEIAKIRAILYKGETNR